jgi:hypothetical protein
MHIFSASLILFILFDKICISFIELNISIRSVDDNILLSYVNSTYSEDGIESAKLSDTIDTWGRSYFSYVNS